MVFGLNWSLKWLILIEKVVRFVLKNEDIQLKNDEENDGV